MAALRFGRRAPFDAILYRSGVPWNRPGTRSIMAITTRGGNPKSPRPRSKRLTIDAAGRASPARRMTSPNHDARPCTSMAITLLVDPRHLASARRVRRRRDRAAVHQSPRSRGAPLLRRRSRSCASRRISSSAATARCCNSSRCNDRAWHAGVSAWEGRARCNDYSIGIELEGTDDVPYAARAVHDAGALGQALRRRYPIAAIVGHSDIAPERKTDPGPAFDWARLRRLVTPLNTPPSTPLSTPPAPGPSRQTPMAPNWRDKV